jgi:hypothetical protein
MLKEKAKNFETKKKLSNPSQMKSGAAFMAQTDRMFSLDINEDVIIYLKENKKR